MNCGGTACGVDPQEVYGLDYPGETVPRADEVPVSWWDEIIPVFWRDEVSLRGTEADGNRLRQRLLNTALRQIGADNEYARAAPGRCGRETRSLAN